MYDVLLRHGEVIDPAQEIHRIASVAIQNGKIAEIADDISEAKAKKVIPAEGKIITPGLIDIHCHPGAGLVWIGVSADEIGLDTGVTLLGDAGTSGWANFQAFRSLVVEKAKTDILCFLNLASTGLATLPEIWSEKDIDIPRLVDVVASNREVIRGIKLRCVQALEESMGIKAVKMAKKIATDHRLPLMIHIGETRKRTEDHKMDDFSRAAVSLMERGDILSHYLTWEPGGLILKDGTIYPELIDAQKRGVLLDSCHGLNHFSFAIARHALDMGMIPDVVSTDLATVSQPAAQSLVVAMSKFLNLGVSLDRVIKMATIHPARALGEDGRRGSLKAGMPADITLLKLERGNFIFSDGTGGERIIGELLLEPTGVFKKGRFYPAFSGYHIPPIYA
ncbi:MAG TPA: amidohydrolase/deacetylase family metallohydrolase [Thermodesulfobacteriota bacterium]|nr:amidohydrolase/deacetylase family metallohydrolase [Thermodesulfobacteriota bacterium]